MPEKVTKEEKIVDLAIAKARKTIETLRESTQVIPYDSTVEVQKIKRPKVQDASKITNQTQDKEGYGLAGESLKKSMVLKFDDEMALNGENVREANSLAPRFVGPHFSINLKRDEITKVLKEFNKKYPNVRLSKVTNGDEYISAFVNLAAYLYPKNVGRTFSNIGESQFKKSSVKKRQTPTSFEQVVQMANEELQSGRVGVNKEILSNIASLYLITNFGRIASFVVFLEANRLTK